jgi:hypothetical protein
LILFKESTLETAATAVLSANAKKVASATEAEKTTKKTEAEPTQAVATALATDAEHAKEVESAIPNVKSSIFVSKQHTAMPKAALAEKKAKEPFDSKDSGKKTFNMRLKHSDKVAKKLYFKNQRWKQRQRPDYQQMPKQWHRQKGKRTMN